MDPINRLVRHLITPGVVLLVERGWLPEWAQHDIVEAGAIGLILAASLAWSWWDDRRAKATGGAT